MILHSLFDAGHARFSAGQFDLRAGKIGREAGQFQWIDVGADFHRGHVFLENRFSAFHTRRSHVDHAVKASGAAQGRIDIVGSVGRADDEDVAAILQPVEQDEQLRYECFVVLPFRETSG